MGVGDELRDNLVRKFELLQGDHRCYSYVVGISSVSDLDWEDLMYYVKIMPRIQ